MGCRAEDNVALGSTGQSRTASKWPRPSDTPEATLPKVHCSWLPHSGDCYTFTGGLPPRFVLKCRYACICMYAGRPGGRRVGRLVGRQVGG